MLKLENIIVSFGNHQVLRDLSCEATKGELVVIVGTNGAGKSTFFDTIAGKIQPRSGKIIIDGTNITKLNELQRSSLLTRIFQNTQLNSVGNLTVAQNLAIAHYSRRPARLVNGMRALPREQAIKIIQELGLPEFILDKKMNSLSGGQRQLVAFSMSTQLIPKVLMLDEPTAALDPQAATKLLQYAVQFVKQHQITTLIITHDPQIALSIGDQIWILEHGKITRVFGAEEKKGLDPAQLIGQIDYAQIAQVKKL